LDKEIQKDLKDVKEDEENEDWYFWCAICDIGCRGGSLCPP